MYFLCEKYHKPITVQYYIAIVLFGLANLVGQLWPTLLHLWTNWTHERALGTERISM